MPRARSLKPGFFTNDELAAVAPIGRLLFAGLWTLADREGRLEDRPIKIKAELLPYDDADANDLLDQLQARGFIQRYDVAGKKYIQVVQFLKHQNPHVKEQASTIPAPCENRSRTVRANVKTVPAGLTPCTDSGLLTPDSIYGLRPDVWGAWRKHRGAKLTPQAVKLQTTKLGELQAKGHDPNAVILQSIERGWSGLFEVRANSPPRGATTGERRAASIAELTGRAKNERAIDGTAERMGSAAIPAIPGDLREPRGDDVGRRTA